MNGENSNAHISQLEKEFDKIKKEWIAVQASMRTNRRWIQVLVSVFAVGILAGLFWPGLSVEEVRTISSEEFDKRLSSKAIDAIVEQKISDNWAKLLQEGRVVFASVVDSILEERVAPGKGRQPATIDGDIVWESIPFNDTLIGSQIYWDSLRPRLTDSINVGGIELGEQFATNDSLELRVILDFPKPQGAVFPILGADVFPKGRIPRGRSLSAKTMTLFKYDGKYNKLRVVTPDKPGMYDLAVFYIEKYDYDCKSYMKIAKIEVVE